MSNIIMLVPVDKNVGLFSISLSINHIAKKKRTNIQIFKFVEDTSCQEKNSILYKEKKENHFEESIIPIFLPKNFFVKYILSKQEDFLIELILSSVYAKVKKETEISFIQGLIFPEWKNCYSTLLNKKLSSAFHAKIILISSTHKIRKKSHFLQKIKILYESFDEEKILGIVFNKIITENSKNLTLLSFLGIENNRDMLFPSFQEKKISFFSIQEKKIPILSCIPWNINLVSVRVLDLVKKINAKILHTGKIKVYRINSIVLCMENFSKILENLTPNTLLIMSANQHDFLISIFLLQEKEKEISILLLVDSDQKIIFLQQQINKYISYAKYIPIFYVKNNFWEVFLNLKSIFESQIPYDDISRINEIQKYMGKYIEDIWINLKNFKFKKCFYKKRKMSPPEFRYRITELARKSRKSIILPEGFEPRTIQAASICSERNIAHCILLGDPDKIQSIAKEKNIHLGKNIDIIDPKSIRYDYVNRLIKIRKNENMTEEIAQKRLKNNILLGTMMLERGIVDGLVSGAVHTTADTIRPSLQIIKTSPKSSLVSSIFFMLFPNQVIIYGDCAINPNPNIEQLSEIAIQSAESAKSFGIEPYIAMISYSTGRSGYGHDVEFVRQATQLVQKKRPDLNIDGPLQYDAAMVQEVALLKAPQSLVAGKATILIFPDLNTGNTTYKAVQRSANLVSIGPMLQGLRKPVNDLSRGALVDDIVYTIALTVIQSTKTEKIA